MCNDPLAPCYVICDIADYNPDYESRNATLCKYTDKHFYIYAAIQPLQKGEVTLICCDKDFKNFDKSILTCYLPKGKKFNQLSCGDILVEY